MPGQAQMLHPEEALHAQFEANLGYRAEFFDEAC